MPDSWNNAVQQLSVIFAPVQRFAPFIASGLTLAAGFCHIPGLRTLMLLLAMILFLWVAADFARSFIERETGFASKAGPPKDLPITPAQIGLTAMLGAVYAFMIITGLHLVFFPYTLLFFLILPVIVVVACLAAWRNVRLWYRQGADYEQALKEVAAETHASPASSAH